MSSKCDFRLDPWSRFSNPEWLTRFNRLLDRPGFSTPAHSAAGTHPSVKVDSADQGWRVSAEDGGFLSIAESTGDEWTAIGRGQGFAGQVGASKCDWRVVTPGVELQGRGGELVRDLQADFLGGRLTFGSAKRDWRVGTGTTDVRTMAEFVSDRFTVETNVGEFGGRWSASKCDWRFGG